MNFALGGLTGSGVLDLLASAGPAIAMGVIAAGLLVASAAALVVAACRGRVRRPAA